MGGIHQGTRPFDNFAMVSNDWLRDPRLTLADKGLLSYVRSHKAGYELTIAQVVAENHCGYDAVNASMKRLAHYGYLRLDRQRSDDGRMGGYDWFLADSDGVPPMPAGAPPEVGDARNSPTGHDQGEQTSTQATPSPENADWTPAGETGRSTSSQPVGNSPTGPQQGKQAVSAGRNQSEKSGPKKTREDYKEDNPPPPPHDQPSETSAPREAATGGEASQESPTEETRQAARGVLRRVLQPVPERRWPINGQRTELTELTMTALANGWSATALVAELGSKDLNAATDTGKVLGYRLRHLPPAPQPSRAGGRRCPRGHIGQPEVGCPICRGEVLGGIEEIKAPEGMPAGRLKRAAALEIMRKRIEQGRLTVRSRERKRTVTIGAAA